MSTHHTPDTRHRGSRCLQHGRSEWEGRGGFGSCQGRSSCPNLEEHAAQEHAAAAGDVDLYKTVVSAGACYNASFRSHDAQRTMTGSAAFGKSSEIVKLVLRTDLGLEQLNVSFGREQTTALHIAVQRGAVVWRTPS